MHLLPLTVVIEISLEYRLVLYNCDEFIGISNYTILVGERKTYDIKLTENFITTAGYMWKMYKSL